MTNGAVSLDSVIVLSVSDACDWPGGVMHLGNAPATLVRLFSLFPSDSIVALSIRTSQMDASSDSFMSSLVLINF